MGIDRLHCDDRGVASDDYGVPVGAAAFFFADFFLATFFVAFLAAFFLAAFLVAFLAAFFAAFFLATVVPPSRETCSDRLRR